MSEATTQGVEKTKSKEDFTTKVMKFVMIALLSVGLIIVGYRVWLHLEDMFMKDKCNDVVSDFDLPVDTEEVDPKLLEKLRKMFKNKDIIAYIVIPDAKVQYPIVQGKDNNEYLHKNIYGKYSISGSIFMDSECNPDFSDNATVIYGHHMIDNSMFGGLSEAFEKSVKGKYFMIYTRTHALRYNVLCSTKTKAYGENVYLTYEGQTMEEFFDALRVRAFKWNKKINTSENSKCVSLMTCYGNGKTHRFGVTGVLKENKNIDIWGDKGENK